MELPSFSHSLEGARKLLPEIKQVLTAPVKRVGRAAGILLLLHMLSESAIAQNSREIPFTIDEFESGLYCGYKGPEAYRVFNNGVGYNGGDYLQFYRDTHPRDPSFPFALGLIPSPYFGQMIIVAMAGPGGMGTQINRITDDGKVINIEVGQYPVEDPNANPCAIAFSHTPDYPSEREYQFNLVPIPVTQTNSN